MRYERRPDCHAVARHADRHAGGMPPACWGACPSWCDTSITLSSELSRNQLRQCQAIFTTECLLLTHRQFCLVPDYIDCLQFFLTHYVAYFATMAVFLSATLIAR